MNLLAHALSVSGQNATDPDLGHRVRLNPETMGDPEITLAHIADAH
jgi:hypothetical protein